MLTGFLVGLPSLVASLVSRNPVVYWIICIGGIGIALSAMFWGDRTWPKKLLSLSVIVSILVFMTTSYQPAVQPAVGYHMMSPTQPGLFERGLKNAQMLGEVTPCTYRLIGWEGPDLLYEETCRDTSHWKFNPATASKSILATDSFVEAATTQPIPHTDVLDRFRVLSVTPPEAELPTRELSIRGSAMLSPDGKWVAVVARHLYGPEDILLVASQSSPSG